MGCWNERVVLVCYALDVYLKYDMLCAILRLCVGNRVG